jgi:hypothetical protein
MEIYLTSDNQVSNSSIAKGAVACPGAKTVL